MPTTKAPVLIGLLTGDAARFAEVSSDSQVVTRAVRSLQLAFRPTHVPEPQASHVTRWGTDPFAMGGYSFFAVGSSPADCEALAEPCGWRKLHLGFAGEATTVPSMGTVLGAWLSGEAEAQRVLKEIAAPTRSTDASTGGGGGGWGSASAANAAGGELARQASGGGAPVSLPRQVSGGELPGLEPIDEKERLERLQFVGRGAGIKPDGELLLFQRSKSSITPACLPVLALALTHLFCWSVAGCTSIFVGNLPYNVSQTAVCDIFKPIGGRQKIVRVSVKQNKGFAHVEFNTTVSPLPFGKCQSCYWEVHWELLSRCCCCCGCRDAWTRRLSICRA